jgi:hypothetical protein
VNAFAKPVALAALVVATALTAAGCGTRVVRTRVVATDGVEAFLRSAKQGRQIVPRGFEHPAIIAPVRLAHILAFVDVEVGEGDKRERMPAVPPDMIYEIGDALALALEKADPDQVAVVRATRLERRFGLFSQRYLSSFLAYVKGGQLFVHFGHVDWEVPKYGPGPNAADELPEPWEDRELMDFRVLPDSVLTTAGRQAISVDWRSERFSEAERIRVSPTGQIKRRNVLLDSAAEPDAEQPAPPPALPPDLSPDALRKLADLEEQRRRGELTEAQYQARRREILAATPAAP